MKMRRGRRRFLALMIACALLAPMAAPAAAQGRALPMSGEEEEIPWWNMPFAQEEQEGDTTASSAPAEEAVTDAPAVSAAEEENAESSAPAEEEAPVQEQAPAQEGE